MSLERARTGSRELRDAPELDDALDAWKQVGGRARRPTSTEILQCEKRGSAAVYRLNGLGPARSAVIAKSRRAGELEIPRRLYSEVLPEIGVPALACYGFVADHNGRSWLFLEDAGDERYSPKIEEHCLLAGEWLAALHSAPVSPAPWLPRLDLDPELLQTAREGVRSCLDHPAVTAANTGILESILRRLEEVEERWGELLAAVAEIPRSLVHGDFIAKNIRVRSVRGRVRLVGLDWDSAGWAAPAYELGVLPRRDEVLRAYHARLRHGRWRPTWSELVHVERLSDLYWTVRFIQWETGSFRYDSIASATRRMEVYERWLRSAVGAFASTGSRT